MEKKGEDRWSEQVEDLVEEGDLDKAISILESQVETLTTTTSSTASFSAAQLRLSSTLSDLVHLYSSKGFSLKADDTRSRARDLKIGLDSIRNCSAQHETSASEESLGDNGRCRQPSAELGENIRSSDCSNDGHLEKSLESATSSLSGQELSDDDWEAMVDRSPEELLPSGISSNISKPLFEEKVVTAQAPKRRGRGMFSYKAHGFLNTQLSDGLIKDDSESETVPHNSTKDTTRNVIYGTRHVIVLADFPPSTTTMDLEKLLTSFKDRGVVIRWVNDANALAVFRSPVTAREACSQIHCPFTTRLLDENDPLMNSIAQEDLEPPRERPKTSTRVASRLIAQGMGIKLPTGGFSSKELKKQEQARRDRIVSRQNMKDDAWGDDL